MNDAIFQRTPRAAFAFTALALAAGCIAAGNAHAQEHRDRDHRPHEAVRPYRTPHMVYDDRFHHGHYYPRLGYSVHALPPGYLSFNYARRRFFFQGGVWFEPVGAGFVVVRPPVGIVVPVLPPAYTTVWAGSVPYYYANDVYYAPTPGGYAVVNPPVGLESAPPGVPGPAVPPPQAAVPPGPAAAPPAQAPGMWYYCESAKAYYPYVGQCPEPWRQVPAAPPQPR